jgi:hypothetical protein
MSVGVVGEDRYAIPIEVIREHDEDEDEGQGKKSSADS